MLQSTYHHRVLSMMKSEDIVKEVQKAYLNQETHHDPKHPGIIFVTAKCSDVPVFSHPLKMHDSVAIDVRTLTRMDKEDNLIMRSQDEFEFLLLRAKLELVWIDEESQPYFTNVAPTASKFYSSYMAENITRLHTLGPDKASIVHVVSAVFFWSQFRPRIDDLEDRQATLLKFVKNATGLPHDYILPILSALPNRSIDHIEAFIATLINLPSLEGSLDGLNVRTLLSATMYSWRGGHAGEVIALSLEYPPCFIAMLVAANKYRAYKHTPLERLISRHRRVDMDEYERSIKGLYADH